MFKKAFFVAAAMLLASAAVALKVQASVIPQPAHAFVQWCNQNWRICKKNDFNNVRTAWTTCRHGSQTVSEVYVHAGDGQKVYKLPHPGFTYSIYLNTVTVSLTTHPHNISWVAVVCEDGQEPTPTPTPSPTPVVTPTPSPTPSPTPGVTPTPSPTPEITPTPTPSATPESTPTATPNPESGKHSSSAISDPICRDNNIDVSLTLMQDGQPVIGVNVKFVYNNEAKFAKTEANGRAGVAFGYVHDGDVKFEPEEGFPSQSQKVELSQSCVPTKTTSTGSVLGATTLAKTGTFEELVFNMVGLTGTITTVIGSALYAKQRQA